MVNNYIKVSIKIERMKKQTWWPIFDFIRLSRIRSLETYAVYLRHYPTEVKEYDKFNNPIYWSKSDG